MTQPILTFGIPTYNGSRTIIKPINSIIKQLTNDTYPKIELLICDNASEDSTIEVLSNLIRKHPKLIRVIKNKKNIGFDRNVNLLMHKAKGTFVWPLADDDVIYDGAVKNILNILDQNPAISVVSVGGFLSSVQQKYIVCQSGELFFDITNFWNGGISSNIFSKSMWLDLGAQKYFGSMWIHFGMLIEMVFKANSIIVRDPMVSEIHGLTKRWGQNGKFIIYHLKLAQIFFNMRNIGYKTKISRKGIKTIHGIDYAKQIVKAKSQGFKFNIKVIIQLCKVYWFFPSFWLCDLIIICFVPRNFCKLIYKVKK